METKSVLLSSTGVIHAGIPCRVRRQRYPLARVQPALKDSVRERADVAALASTLYRRKASALTVMQTPQYPHSTFPALSFSKIDEFQVKEIQIMACAYLPKVWACCGHILVLCRVPSPGLLSRVCKHTKRPVVRLLVVALRHLRTHRTCVNVRLRQGRMRS